MTSTIDLLLDMPRRFGYLTEPKFLRTVIPAGVIGTYLLLDGSRSVYIGRSDTCLLNRLCNHELLDLSTHVVWEPCDTAEKAFRLEAAWYHNYVPQGLLINQIHPAKPVGYKKSCPFCGKKDMEALQFALPGFYEPIAV